jgi:ABC-type branched-subunit amino acid transport system permease subunit
MIFGPFLVLVVLFARGGLIGAWERIAAWRKGAHRG